MIETVIVKSGEELVFVFKDQTKVSWVKVEDATGKEQSATHKRNFEVTLYQIEPEKIRVCDYFNG